MGYPLTNEYYRREVKKTIRTYDGDIVEHATIYRKRPKFPKGKAEKKAWKRRTHQPGHYLVIKAARRLQRFMQANNQ